MTTLLMAIVLVVGANMCVCVGGEGGGGLINFVRPPHTIGKSVSVQIRPWDEQGSTIFFC